MATVNETFNVQDMHCAGCETRVQAMLSRQEGVIKADADHKTGKVILRFDPERISKEQIKQAIQAAGYDVA